MTTTEKTREGRLRRLADHHGYRLNRSRSRDPHALGFGLYALTSVETGGIVNPSLAGCCAFAWNLDDVEHWLVN